MSQPKEMAQLRAETALGNTTSSNMDHVFHLGTYSASYSGRSISASLGSQFVDYHDLKKKDSLVQFFDVESGALVILPAESPDDKDSINTASGGD